MTQAWLGALLPACAHFYKYILIGEGGLQTQARESKIQTSHALDEMDRNPLKLGKYLISLGPQLKAHSVPEIQITPYQSSTV